MKIKSMLASLSVVVFVLVLGSSGAYGDNEPNDDISNSEVILDDSVSGSVTDEDMDFYTYYLQGKSTVEVRLEMTEGDSVELSSVDEDGDRIWFSGITISCSEYRSADKDEITNKDSETEVHRFKVSGNGSYLLTIEVSDIPDHADEHSSRATAMEIDEGTYQGDVTSGDFLMDNGDVDYYLVKVPVNHRLEVTLTFLEEDKDDMFPMISLEGDGETDGLFDFFMITLTEEGDSETADHVNDMGSTEDYYIIIEGDGSYSMEVSLEDLEGEDHSAPDIICTGFLIICGGGLALIIIALMITILVIMIRNKK